MKIKYNTISTIRYMGNKDKLLKYIIPEIEKITKPGDVIVDLMAGTHSVSYALKDKYKVISNDIQYYSYVVGKALMSNYDIPDKKEIKKLLDGYIKINMQDRIFTFFEREYTDTYFSGQQCIDIDNLRFGIEHFKEPIKSYLLTVLMSVMCRVQSSTGHFAQYMPKDHKRIIPLRKLNVYKIFFEKMDDFSSFHISNKENVVYNMDYKKLLEDDLISNVDLIYLDSPYTTDQYSRFYHVLETVALYDNPELFFKGKYRDDRVSSLFSYKAHVANEFRTVISYASNNDIKMVISYSDKGVIELKELEEIAKEYFKDVRTVYIDYNHSTQGKGTVKRKEIIMILE